MIEPHNTFGVLWTKFSTHVMQVWIQTIFIQRKRKNELIHQKLYIDIIFRFSLLWKWVFTKNELFHLTNLSRIRYLKVFIRAYLAHIKTPWPFDFACRILFPFYEIMWSLTCCRYPLEDLASKWVTRVVGIQVNLLFGPLLKKIIISIIFLNLTEY